MSVDDVEVLEKNPEIKLIMDNWTIVWWNIEKSIVKWWLEKTKVFELIVTTIKSKELTLEEWEKGLKKFLNEEETNILIKEAFDYNEIKSNTENVKDNVSKLVN